MCLVAAALVLSFGGAFRQDPGPFVWVEGEKADRSQTYRNGWFDAVDPAELSGGSQIASFSEPTKPAGWAEYDFSVQTASKYQLWLRANPGTGIRFQLDHGEWQTLDADALEKQDAAHRNEGGYIRRRGRQMNVAVDGTFDAREMTWFWPTSYQLTEGHHTIRIELGGQEAAKARYAAIDCFVLVPGYLDPEFQLNQQLSAKAQIKSVDPATTWSFSPQTDALSSDALFDLRSLNEKTAGEHGFIRLSKDGEGFVRGDGQPIRFWAGCDYVQRIAHDQKNQAPLEHHAQFLAKRGVNLVRLHGGIESKSPDSNLDDVDADELDQMYRLVAAMKKAGIYTMIDPYWAVSAHAQPKWGVPDSGNGNLTGLIFFDPTLQRGYKAWLKKIYADPNPYTGIPLAKDPSIAAIQLQNEDSLLFWTSQSIKGPALVELRRQFGQFLTKKYGSLSAAMDHWQGAKTDDDDMANGLPGLMIVWMMTQEGRNKSAPSPGRDVRLADQTEFFATTMRNFNAEMVRYLKQDLGCRQLVLPGNWRTADQVTLDDAERWSYLAGDIEGKNHYFTGVHNGLNDGWQILPGHVYTSRSWIKDPVGSPLGIRQAVGRPFMIPETLWVPPNKYESEGPVIASAQSSLTGMGPMFWFADGTEEWDGPGTIWTFAVPMTLGQFPAAALAYRRGDVEESKPVVHEERTDADVFNRRVPMIAEEGAWDPNRDKVQLPVGAGYGAEVDPLAFLAGRVEVKYGGDPSKSRSVPLGPYVANGTVKSLTGQITTDITHGIYRVDTLRFQSIEGFLGAAGEQSLSDLAVSCQNPFASVAAISLDGKPLAESGHVLIQVGTDEHPTGWKEKPMEAKLGDGKFPAYRIVDTGHGPWQIGKAHMTVRVRSKTAKVVQALDPNGMPVGSVPMKRDGEWISFEFPADALYVAVE